MQLWSNTVLLQPDYGFICIAMSANIKEILAGRVVRNIYFWVATILFLYLLNIGANDYDRSVYNKYKAITTALLITMSYVNNLVLIPRFLARRKSLLYFLSAILLTLLTASAYVVVIKDMLQTYPKIKTYDISLITSPVSADWSLQAILQDVPTYAFGLGLWVAIFTMAWYVMDHTRQQKLAQAAANKQMETELSLLRNQVSPHFFFNTLNNIYGLTLQHSDKAPESILKLSSIMRYLLYETNTKKISFEKEQEAMQAYIDMELLRLPHNEQFQFHIEADGNYSITPLLWLPVLENAFKHGTRVIIDNYFINYSFTIANGVMTIIAENNYKEQTGNKTGGIGLANLRKRLDLLYPGKHTIDIDKTSEKYRIEITVILN